MHSEATFIPILEEEPLRSLSKKEAQIFSELWEKRTLSAGSSVFPKDQKEMGFLYVHSGRIQVRLVMEKTDLLVKTLTEGQSFGIQEFALGVLSKNLLISEENSEVSLLPLQKAIDFFSSSKKIQGIWEQFVGEAKLRDELRIHPFFRKLSMQELAELAKLLKKRKISKSQVIIEEGSLSSSLFFIQSGKFKITKSSWAVGYFSTVEAGSVLGEMGVIEKKARSATVTAMEESIVYELLAEDAEDFFKKSESLYTTLRSVTEERKWNQKETEVDAIVLEKDDYYDSVFYIPQEVYKPKLGAFHKFPLVLEELPEETAFACRTMMLQAYGVSITEINQEIEFPRYDSEISQASWKLAFASFPLDSYVVKRSEHETDLGKRLWIGKWENFKYVVVLEYNSVYVKIADPSQGILTIKRAEAENSLADLAICIQWKKNPETNFLKKFNLFPNLLESLRETYTFIFSGILASFLIKILQIGLPILNLYIIDSVLLKESKEHFSFVVTSIFLLSLSQIVLSYLRTNVLFYSASKINQMLVVRFLEKLLSFPLPFFERNKKGEILQRWEELEFITQFFSEQGAVKILDWIFGFIVISIFFFLSPLLLVLVLLFLIPEVYILFRLSPQLVAETKKESLRSADTLSYFIETLHGHETIKNLGAMSVQRWDFEKRLTSQINTMGRRMYLSAILETSSESFRLVTNLVIIFVGTYLILSHSITIGTLVAILGLIGYIRGPMLSFAQDFYQYQRASLSWKKQRTWEKMKGEFTQDDRMSHIEIPDIQGNVEFKNIGFQYQTQKQGRNLENISFSLEPGKKVALVGRSGSGKSTLLKLLLLYYEPHEGEITIDGIQLSEIWLPSFRSKVGVVFQESSLVSGTIRENISLYRPEATLSEVVESAKLALLHDDIIKLPLGYDTDMADQEFGLSGGQKQKLSFARVFLQKPSLLLLDEPTSAMDKESEEKILKNLYEQFSDKTFLVVAHRLETIRNFDQIYVLERGKIAENGTHRELLAKKGIYHLLHSRQEAIR